MRCWVQPRHRIPVKGYGFMSFDKNVGKNINKNISGKYNQKCFDHAKQCVTGALKTTSKGVIKKTRICN